MALEGTFEKLPTSESVIFNLEVVDGQITPYKYHLSNCGHFNNFSRSIIGIKFTMWQLTLALKELCRILPRKRFSCSSLGMHMPILSRTSSGSLFGGIILTGIWRKRLH